MKKINITDSAFGHALSISPGSSPSFFSWFRGDEVVSDSCFFTDTDLHRAKSARHKRKIAWLIEPRAINPNTYEYVTKNNRDFDYVLTYDSILVARGENFLFSPISSSWVKDTSNLTKTKLCSFIGSNKKFAEGHNLRQTIHHSKLPKVDCFGRGIKTISTKEEALNEYMFSIVVENSKQPVYFTEKLIDCFLTRTVPIYWGTNVDCFFNNSGILYFNTIDELKHIEDLSIKDYNDMLPSIIDNEKRVHDQGYAIPEDWMHIHYPFLFE